MSGTNTTRRPKLRPNLVAGTAAVLAVGGLGLAMGLIANEDPGDQAAGDADLAIVATAAEPVPDRAAPAFVAYAAEPVRTPSAGDVLAWIEAKQPARNDPPQAAAEPVEADVPLVLAWIVEQQEQVSARRHATAAAGSEAAAPVLAWIVDQQRRAAADRTARSEGASDIFAWIVQRQQAAANRDAASGEVLGWIVERQRAHRAQEPQD